MTWTDERSLNETDLDPDPHRQFRVWFHEAHDAGEPLPNAMALATCSREGIPSVRMVLFEDIDEHGIAFQTNRESPKAQDLAAIPHAAATFFWPRLLRQVRISGRVHELSREEAAKYFSAEPPAIQTMLRACRQSTVVADRATLERTYARALAAPGDGLPEHWGTYRIAISSIEFFQGRQNWLQDRLKYTRTADGSWHIERLVP